MGASAVVVVRGGLVDRDNLEQTLRACEASADLVDAADVHDELAPLIATLPPATRVIAVGDWNGVADAALGAPDCVLLDQPDAATLRGVLEPGPVVTAETLLGELLDLSAFGASLPETWQEVATRLARAFLADDCLVLVPEEATCYLARPGASADEIDDLVRVAATVSRYPSTLIAPSRPGRRYRAFLGIPLAHESAEPLAIVLLCRTRPAPFGRYAYAHLRQFVRRLAGDLSSRVIHERLLQDRDKLRELSRIDPVLGVANRTGLQEELARRLTEAERRGEALSVAVIDVDGLRLINERHGYPAGDAVLTHVAQVARVQTRMQDVVARYAAGSVAVVLPATATDQALEVITRILGEIDAAPVLHEGRPINLTVSAGIAGVRSVDDTGEAALGRALAARQHARRHGEVIAVADASMPASAAQPDLLVGATLGGVYQIRHEISNGAFGVVYRAEDLALGRQAALKLLRSDLARNASFVENFRSEAATLARIRHPNLVQVYAFGIDAAHVYFAMELVEGQSLAHRIHSARKRRRYLPVQELLGYVHQVAEALEAVHRAGMVHRDVKPENVLIDRIHRRCVLIDVGIAIRRGGTSRAGTPGFTPPEVFEGEAGTPASDVYSLGALAYVLLTSRPPFGEGAVIEILARQATESPPRPSDLRHDLPPAVDELLLASLSTDPSRRPASARALAEALAELLEQPDVALRLTMERPIADAIIPAKPIVAYDPSSQQGTITSAPSSRGVLFRAAYEVLGARRGAAWIADVSRRIPELAVAITPQGSSLAWHPTSAFEALLESLGDEHVRTAHAYQLGQLAAELTLRQFYGAAPTSAGPAQVLRSVDLLWRCYHTWGSGSVVVHPTAAEVTIADGRAGPLLCAASSGLLAGIVAGAGGIAPAVEHRVCAADGGGRCVFALRWS